MRRTDRLCDQSLSVDHCFDLYPREASGSQPTRFLIASDKFGNSAFPNAIIPAEVAAATARILSLGPPPCEDEHDYHRGADGKDAVGVDGGAPETYQQFVGHAQLSIKC